MAQTNSSGGWLARRCWFCGQAAAPLLEGICEACQQELPFNHLSCVRCGLPLAQTAVACGRCQRRAPPWDGIWAPFRYAWPLDRALLRFKFSGDLAAGRMLAYLWSRQPRPMSRPVWLVPIPLHRRRLGERGYNQALELARPLARDHPLALMPRALCRQRATQAQSELDATARRRNVRHAFALASRYPWPDHVALLDDVMTTGSTLAEATTLLKRAGVQRVDVWTLARAAR